MGSSNATATPRRIASQMVQYRFKARVPAGHTNRHELLLILSVPHVLVHPENHWYFTLFVHHSGP
jgi:hypothetical protein